MEHVVKPTQDDQTPVTTTAIVQEDNSSPDVDCQFYPVDRIIRGKSTPEGIKYLIKWQGYSSKHNTWEKADDLSPDTLEYLKHHPVRIFGRKPVNPEPVQSKKPENLNPATMTEEQLKVAYEASTIVDSDEEDCQDI